MEYNYVIIAKQCKTVDEYNTILQCGNEQVQAAIRELGIMYTVAAGFGKMNPNKKELEDMERIADSNYVISNKEMGITFYLEFDFAVFANIAGLIIDFIVDKNNLEEIMEEETNDCE